MGDEYQTVDRIKSRISYTPSQFNEYEQDVEFDDLLEMLEEESRAIIDSYMGDESFNYEEDREDRIMARDTKGLSLIYPVQDVKKVETKRFGSDWDELDSNNWTFDDHSLYLRKYNRRLFDVHGRDYYTMRDVRDLNWSDFCTEVRVTYDRGFEDIPDNILNIQISIISNILNEMRQKQANSVFDPSDNNLVVDLDQIMSKDIEKRLKDITSFGKNAVIL